ncbi:MULTISPECIES: GNAT family N-acetyltransferase [Arthrobacter]|uniref:GNAT family N-acetyltransferase n=1 Tax=unclassified Arthrobacter TaxID=235627 RepID=UPI0024BB3169|nr:GNAT family N-acetyltransferase [Arthrobacter sp. H35-MC1]MDJ0317012.1 GNAT family N-acetyltransferase [Arthrobacter sp. H35-MC1]
MTFEISSAPIVFLAWERGLGLPADSLLADTGNARIIHPVPSQTLTFIRLWDRSILTGPVHLLSAADAFDDDELSDHSTMLRLTRADGGRGMGTQALYYADDLELHQPEGTVHVSTAPEQAMELESLCPPDDVNDVALATRANKFTVMQTGTPDAGPLACSAYGEYQGLLAQLGTLVAPEFRRQGVGALATSIAAHEALSAGLIVQWRADVNNAGAHALATSLGLSVAGLQTQVHLQSH